MNEYGRSSLEVPKIPDFNPNFMLNQKSIMNIKKQNHQNQRRPNQLEKTNSAESKRNHSIEKFLNDMKQNLENSVSGELKLNEQSAKSGLTKD